MIVIVRIYRQHDLDLMTLFYNPHIQLGRLMKKVLINYASDEPLTALDFEEPEDTIGYVSPSTRLQINLNEKNEKELNAINLLKSIKPGYRCSFIKALFRNSCAYLPMVAYTMGSDFSMRKTMVAKPAVDVVENASKKTKTETSPADALKNPESFGKSVDDNIIKMESVKPTLISPTLPERVSDDTETPKTEDLDDLFNAFNKIG